MAWLWATPGSLFYTYLKKSVTTIQYTITWPRPDTRLLYLPPPHLLTHSEPPTTWCPLPIGPANSSKPRLRYKYHVLLSLTILHALHPAYEDGTERVFRNVGKPQSDAGEIPKRIQTKGYVVYTAVWFLLNKLLLFLCVLLALILDFHRTGAMLYIPWTHNPTYLLQ